MTEAQAEVVRTDEALQTAKVASKAAKKALKKAKKAARQARKQLKALKKRRMKRVLAAAKKKPTLSRERAPGAEQAAGGEVAAVS